MLYERYLSRFSWPGKHGHSNRLADYGPFEFVSGTEFLMRQQNYLNWIVKFARHLDFAQALERRYPAVARRH